MYQQSSTEKFSLSAARIGSVGIVLGMVALMMGCTQNPYLAGPGAGAWQGSPTTAAVNPTEAQLSELNRRVQLLDDNNRQLHTQLAQSEQQSQVYRDELNLVRKQLSDTTTRLESTSIAANQAANRVRGMQASTQMRGSASIRPNTNLSQLANRLNLSGIPVQRDGDVLRVIVPADQLFAPGTAQMHPQAALTLDPVAAQLRSVFLRDSVSGSKATPTTPLSTADKSQRLTSLRPRRLPRSWIC